MKKERLTFTHKAILLISIMSLLLTINTGILLVLIFKQEGMGLQFKIAAISLLALEVIIFGILIKEWIIIPYLDYIKLLKRFASGQIYQELLDKAGYIFPGMQEVLQHYDKLLNNQKIIQRTKRQSEFLALQNQINPHFLYNTLEAIRGDALCVGMDNIANITEALATFFRYTITDTGSLVTVEDELENVDNYFKIQKYRFGEKLEIVFEIPENESDILQLQCPKLTLQPIIENAIFHGLEKKSEGGIMHILIELAGNKLLISIKDNGVGIEEEQLEKINQRLEHMTPAYLSEENKNKKGGIALYNVCRRIKLLFGEDYGIHVYSIAGYGTDVRITLPLVKKERGFSYEGRINSH